MLHIHWPHSSCNALRPCSAQCRWVLCSTSSCNVLATSLKITPAREQCMALGCMAAAQSKSLHARDCCKQLCSLSEISTVPAIVHGDCLRLHPFRPLLHTRNMPQHTGVGVLDANHHLMIMSCMTQFKHVFHQQVGLIQLFLCSWWKVCQSQWLCFAAQFGPPCARPHIPENADELASISSPNNQGNMVAQCIQASQPIKCAFASAHVLLYAMTWTGLKTNWHSWDHLAGE